MIMRKTMSPCANTHMIMCKWGKWPCTNGHDHVQMGMTMCKGTWPCANGNDHVQRDVSLYPNGHNHVHMPMIRFKPAWPCANRHVDEQMGKTYANPHAQSCMFAWPCAYGHHHVLSPLAWPPCANTSMIRCKTMKPCANMHDHVQMGISSWTKWHDHKHTLISMIMCKTVQPCANGHIITSKLA